MENLSSLFNAEGLHFLLRWLHTFAGIVWIGHLYYLNFVQGAFMNDVDAPTKSIAQQKLFPRAFWWFRYGALWTFIIGLVLLLYRGHQQGEAFQLSSYWVNILTGAVMGSIMAYNVWFVIWPTQKRVIQSAIQVAGGGQAIPDLAPRVARAALASRTNVLLSVPMLFFMNAASHWQYGADLASSSTTIYFVVATILLAVIEGNVFKGKMGPLTTIKGVLTSAFILCAVFIVLIAILVRPAAA